MVFQPGEPRPAGAGRKKGTPNKRTAAINDALCYVAEQQLPRLIPLIETMGQSKQVNAILKLLALTLPRAGMPVAAADDDDSTPASPPFETIKH